MVKFQVWMRLLNNIPLMDESRMPWSEAIVDLYLLFEYIYLFLLLFENQTNNFLLDSE